jgi:hypothetical protein
VKRGEELMAASEPFCKMYKNCELPLAGPLSEQFSLASCIYNIRSGHIPFHDMEAPDRVQKPIANEFPSTAEDGIFSDLTQKCWHGGYRSVEAMKHEVDTLVWDDIRAECIGFLKRESTTSKSRPRPAGWGQVVEGTAVEGTAVEGTAVEGTAVEGTAVEGAVVEGAVVEGAVVEANDVVEGSVDQGSVMRT